MIYLDSSALLKLLVEEQESEALTTWLFARPDVPMVSSELAKVEVIRAARRIDPALVSRSRALIAAVDLVPLASDVIDRASDLGEPLLRSLDAIHLATAVLIADELEHFVAYDQRLANAAAAVPLPVQQPGV